jgi:DNA mismatch repair protein MutS
VVFLHQIQEGPANRSFGLQVAKLAGVPDSILSVAKDKLNELESGRSAGPSPTQTELFLPASEPTSPALEALHSLDPDTLTAKEALDWIYQLKQKLDDKT